MKKLALALLTLPAFLYALGAACPGGAVTCTSDGDCANATNSAGEATPFCDTDAQLCIPASDDCADDIDCQLINPDAPTTVEDCSTNADCGAGDERCIETAGGTVCAVVGQAADCGSDVSISVDDIEGNAVDVCASADGTCEASGACTF